ncbi:MAG: hypothetical protein SPK15_02325, partial [Candidatus Onthomorpha sp.]|nr:hypothetical protein [Candidatus Onthomorpha sp.]
MKKQQKNKGKNSEKIRKKTTRFCPSISTNKDRSSYNLIGRLVFSKQFYIVEPLKKETAGEVEFFLGGGIMMVGKGVEGL